MDSAGNLDMMGGGGMDREERRRVHMRRDSISTMNNLDTRF